MQKRGDTVWKGLSFSILLCFPLLILATWLDQKKSLPKFDSPLLITSCGQNAEVHTVSVLAKRAGLDFVLLKTAGSKDLDGIKSLALVLGASLKGMGAAGLDLDQEKHRIQKLIIQAQKIGIPILCLHLGGEARRGPLSDDMIMRFIPHADMVFVTKQGNRDQLFNSLCSPSGIPLIEVERAVDALESFKNAFINEEQNNE